MITCQDGWMITCQDGWLIFVDGLLTQKRQTYDHLFIVLILFRLKSKFVFLIDGGMYLSQSPKSSTNFMEIFELL
jgi:hypothetical protein